MSDDRTSRPNRFELWRALLLAAATVASAWSAYQSARWGGIQTFKLGEANAAGRTSAERRLIAHQRLSIQISLFMSWLNARDAGRSELDEFYRQRFGEPLASAFAAWMAQAPFTNAEAAPHPFVMPEYVMPEALEADELQALSQQRVNEAQQANRTSDDYVLSIVLFASALFFAGIAPQFGRLGFRIAVLALGSLTLLAATVRLIGLPIAPG